MYIFVVIYLSSTLIYSNFHFATIGKNPKTVTLLITNLLPWTIVHGTHELPSQHALMININFWIYRVRVHTYSHQSLVSIVCVFQFYILKKSCLYVFIFLSFVFVLVLHVTRTGVRKFCAIFSSSHRRPNTNLKYIWTLYA